MGLSDWLRVFRTLHEKAKKGELSAEDARTYRDGCDELARALIAAQRLTLKPGEVPRQTLRVARALQVDLETRISHVRAMTTEIGVGGFSAILAKAPPAADEQECSLRIPGGEPIKVAAAVADVKPQAGSVRVSFAFRKLSDADRARLELLVIDTALSQLAG